MSSTSIIIPKARKKNDYVNVTPDWMQEVNALRLVCMEAGIDPLIERSRSGRGAHLWIFFEKPVSVKMARTFGNALPQKGAASVSMKTYAYYDRMLPAQDVLPEGSIGNLIALPLQPRIQNQIRRLAAFGNPVFY